MLVRSMLVFFKEQTSTGAKEWFSQHNQTQGFSLRKLQLHVVLTPYQSSCEYDQGFLFFWWMRFANFLSYYSGIHATEHDRHEKQERVLCVVEW